MCLCKGKGNVVLVNAGVATWHKCPDSHCTHDKEQSEQKWQQFKKEMREWEKSESVVS